MSKRCSKCEKTVYPIEELKCLDKVWHKACFKCEACGMTLNMKNYKGYDKKPYCNAHYPTQKFTQVADTPEMARLTQNTKNQSNLKYHEDFEKQKGKFTQVADDPETLRLMENSAKFSSIKYHSEFEQSKGKYTSVADDPETLRVLKNQENISLIKYHEDFEKNIKGTKIQVTDDPETQRVMEHSKVVSQIEYKGLRQQNMDMDQKRASIPTEHQPSPYSAKFTGQSTMYTHQGQTVEQPRGRRVGSINDYDPMNERWGSAAAGQHAQYTGGPTSGNQWEERVQLPRQNHPQQQPQYYPPPAQPAQPQQPAYQPPSQPAYQPPAPQPAPVHSPAAKKGPIYTAMYDYEAQDDDEISFQDGDTIINVEPIDEGWMFGTVQRTGQHGMLPANYVERVA